jgi:hypothetical protein
MKGKILYWFLVIVIVLAGCSTGSETPPEVIGTATASPTPQPTNTPTPLAPVGVFLTPEGSNPGLIEELGPLVGKYIKEEGLRYQILPNLTASDFQNEQYAIVVVIPPFPELTALAESAPDTKFLAIGFDGLNTGDNLSLLGSGGADFDIQGFIAGYIAAMITPDWRVGALSVQDDPNALAARNGFRTGVKYFCGLCNPKYAPTGINYLYPKFIDLPAGAADAEISVNIDILVDRFVNTFYIIPGVGTPQIYRKLIANEKNIIGSGIDYREEYRDFWVASLEYDLVNALVEFWPRFLETETGLEELPPLLITDVNPDLLSEGKLILVGKILEEVQAGFIKTSYD